MNNAGFELAGVAAVIILSMSVVTVASLCSAGSWKITMFTGTVSLDVLMPDPYTI